MSNKSNASAVGAWDEIFGLPPVLEGEDPAAYDELTARMYAAVKPVDIIEEMYLVDIVSLEWEILRWRRFKLNVLQGLRLKAVRSFLREHISYHVYREKSEEALAEILLDNLEEGQTEERARKLARDCARNSSEAVDAVNGILASIDMHMDEILDKAKADKAEEIARDYARHKPSALKLVDRLLAEAGVKMDDLVVEQFGTELQFIESIDRLITIAETRRNASLREIDRRRATFGAAVRRSVQQIEQDNVKLIETAPTGEETA